MIHSQKLSETPLRPWVVVRKDGSVQAAHCDCMAGLGEACTHVAALLFAVEANVRVRELKTVTQEKAYWMLPCALKRVKYSPLADMDFTSAKTKAKKLTNSLESSEEGSDNALASTAKAESFIPPPTQHDTDEFFQNLHATGTKSVILTITSPYSDEFVPLSMQSAFPQPLTSVYNGSYADLPYKDLVEICANINVSVSQEQAIAVEVHTRGQAASKLWYRYRAGRITASRMKAACHTKLTSPSKSLILAICNPSAVRFSNKATEWGCKHKKNSERSVLPSDEK